MESMSVLEKVMDWYTTDSFLIKILQKESVSKKVDCSMLAFYNVSCIHILGEIFWLHSEI